MIIRKRKISTRADDKKMKPARGNYGSEHHLAPYISCRHERPQLYCFLPKRIRNVNQIIQKNLRRQTAGLKKREGDIQCSMLLKEIAF
jgi:hypothetical protein